MSMLIEQAIFASTQTSRADGYQLARRSAGVRDDDAAELAAWGPSHDSLLDSGTSGVSHSFHALPSGAYCVAKTWPAGAEYSARGGLQVCTHSLVVPAEVLARFANNPFAVLQAVAAAGQMHPWDRLPDRLEPLTLVGRASPIDRALLAQLVGTVGPTALARIVEAVLAHKRVVIVGSQRPDHLLAGVINCLPVEYRPQVSLSTGLRFSPRRPFRLMWLGEDRREARRLARQHGVALLDLGEIDLSRSAAPSEGWPGLVALALRSGHASILASDLGQHPSRLTPEGLAPLGDQLRAQLESNLPAEKRSERSVAAAGLPSERLKAEPDAAGTHRADGAHFRQSSATAVAATPRRSEAAPSKLLVTHDEQTLDLLECLDDAVYEAMSGDQAALGRVELLWPVVLDQVGREMAEESRLQYLRYALALWGDVPAGKPLEPARASAALDVLCLLFRDGQ